MALLITAILYSMSWGLTFFNSNIIHYRSFTNDILLKYDVFNRILKWLNAILFLIATVAFIAEFMMKARSKAFLVFLSEFVVLALLFIPVTTLTFEVLYNKVFLYINRVFTAIYALFTLAYIAYPFFIIKILDVDDQTKIAISQGFLTVELYMFLVLFIYMVFLVYQTSTLSHKVLLIERYSRQHPKYRLPEKLKAKKYHWIVPMVFDKHLLQDVINNKRAYELILTKYRYLPDIKTGTPLSQKKAKKQEQKTKHKINKALKKKKRK